MIRQYVSKWNRYIIISIISHTTQSIKEYMVTTACVDVFISTDLLENSIL